MAAFFDTVHEMTENEWVEESSSDSSSVSGVSDASYIDQRKLHRVTQSLLRNARAIDAPSVLHALIYSLPLIRRRSGREAAWSAILCRAQSHGRREGPLLDTCGRTALHAACAYRPPLHVVRALLKACGKGSIAARDKDGRTALAVAFAGGAHLAVCRLLLRLCPSSAFLADGMGMLPLHLACAYKEDTLHGNVGPALCNTAEQLVNMLLKLNPDSASAECNFGRTPLHVAVESLANFRVIQSLLKGGPNAVCLEGCGSTPLAIAIRYNAPLMTVKELVEANPFAARKLDSISKLYPIHHAIQYSRSVDMIEFLADAVGPSLIALKDDFGQTALHVALGKALSERGQYAWTVAHILLDRDWRLAKIRNKVGMSPLDLMCRCYSQALQNTPFGKTLFVVRGRKMVKHKHLKQVWTIISLVLEKERKGQTLLHAALRADCPKEVIKQVLCFYPHNVKTVDHQRLLPLHLVLRKNPPQGKGAAGSCIVDIFLGIHPAAAAIPNPADGKRLPLHTATRCGWLELGSLLRLMNACPEALHTPDPVTGFYAFQLAAVFVQPMFMNWGLEEKWEMLRLNSVFILLQAAPEQVALALHKI